MSDTRQLYCCGCQTLVKAKLTDGAEIYPHRPDLSDLPFWKCACGLFVGCHHKTEDRTRPLGCIPTKELKEARKHLHAKLDPLWKSGKISRKELYQKITNRIGWTYHTAKLRTVDEAREVYRIVQQIEMDIK